MHITSPIAQVDPFRSTADLARYPARRPSSSRRGSRPGPAVPAGRATGAPRPARGARLRRGARHRDDAVVARGPGAKPRLGDRDRRRRALDRRRLDLERRADPHPRGGRAHVRRPASRFEWLETRPAVVWPTASAPEGFPCRIERIGADATEWDERHQHTSGWSPFNYQLTVRVLRSGASVGVARGERYTVDPDGSVSSRELDAHERVRLLSRSSASPRRSRSGSRRPAAAAPPLTRSVSGTPNRSSHPLARRVAPTSVSDPCVASVTNAVPQPTTTAGRAPPRLATWSNGREGGGACTTSPRHGCC